MEDNSPDGTLEVAQSLQKLYGADVRAPAHPQPRMPRGSLSICWNIALLTRSASYVDARVLVQRFKIHKRPGKMGLGSAYRDGLKEATGTFVIILDADLSHHVRATRARWPSLELVWDPDTTVVLCPRSRSSFLSSSRKSPSSSPDCAMQPVLNAALRLLDPLQKTTGG